MLRDSPLDTERLISQTRAPILLRDHLIGLVQDEDPDELGVEDGRAARHHVQQCTGRADKDLLLDFDPSLPTLRNCQERLDFGELSNLVDDLLDLTRELSRRSETDGLS